MFKWIIGIFIEKFLGILMDAWKDYQKNKAEKAARNAEIQSKKEALKNAKTPEEQEKAAAELIRVTAGK